MKKFKDAAGETLEEKAADMVKDIDVKGLNIVTTAYYTKSKNTVGLECQRGGLMHKWSNLSIHQADAIEYALARKLEALEEA